MDRDDSSTVLFHLVAVELEDFHCDILAHLEQLTYHKQSRCGEVALIDKAHLKHALQEGGDALNVSISTDGTEGKPEEIVELRILGQVHFVKCFVERAIEAISKRASLALLSIRLSHIDLAQLGR